MPKRTTGQLISSTSPLLIALLLAFVVGDVGCSQQVPGPLPPSTTCAADDDCPAGPCKQGVCTQNTTQESSNSETQTQDSSTADTPPPEPPPDQPIPDVPPLPPPPPGTCTPGQTWECFTGAPHKRTQGQCRTGKHTCLADKTWSDCKGEVLPDKQEKCDGEDNDCDGQTDEGFPNLGLPCYLGDGACYVEGVRICTKDQKNIECSVKPGKGTAEVCDGKDNDCDGEIDEDFPDKGQPCSQGKGVCLSKGIQVCASDGTKTICSAKQILPTEEKCNGLDDDCDGQVDNNPSSASPLTRECYSGPAKTKGVGKCKAGIETCTKAAWSTCKGQVLPAAKDACINKTDDDCNGKADEKCECTGEADRSCGTNVGECTTGTQECDADNKWSACTGKGPTTELCDGKDNNCNGQTDENFPNKGKTCEVGLGACKVTGIYICGPNRQGLICNKKPGPSSAEICDNIDNNCDGKVDENLDGTPCNTTLKGICADGTRTCLNGKETCTPKNQPKQERCRNGKDDDCNGQVDEICGPLHAYALVKPDGTSSAKRGFTLTRKTSTGTYELTHPNIDCRKHPLFLTANSRWMHALSYSCNQNIYVVHASARVKNVPVNGVFTKGDVGFHAILPHSGETWTLVNGGQCSSGGNKCAQAHASGASLNISRPRRGNYRIDTPLCSVSWRPLFFSIRSNGSGPTGYISGHKSSRGSYCWVTAFNGKGEAADRSFSLWLPDLNTSAWASIGYNFGGSQIHKSNSPGTTKTLWNSKHTYSVNSPTNCPQTGNCSRINVSYLGWAYPSFPVAIYRRTQLGTASAFLDNGTYQITLFYGTKGQVGDGVVTLLFVQ